MLNRYIYNAVSAFHSAIMEAKYNNEFDWRDRMSNFPGGCCDDASGIYIGKENAFYQGLEDKVIYKNCDITQDERLWNDYLKTMKYI